LLVASNQQPATSNYSVRWFTFFILAYVAVALQSGLGGYVQIHGAVPDLVLLAVIFICLNAPRDAALLGCFVLGLIQDLLTLQPPGTYALAYGLFGLLAVKAREELPRQHPLSHAGLALIGGLITGFILAARGWVRPPGASLWTGILSAVYTAILAPAVIWGLQRFRRAFSFAPQRRR
jgi:rod shape-determining protein MreD